MSCTPITLKKDVKTQLTTSWTNINFPRSGGAIVVLGAFSNCEISLDGGSHANAMPLSHAAVFEWPELDADDFESFSGIAIRQTGGGSGAVTVVHASSHEEAAAIAEKWGGSGAPNDGTDGIPEGSMFSAGATATGAAAAYSTQATSLYTTILADPVNTASVFVAESLAKATAANGFPLAPGASAKWFGPLFLFSVAAQSVNPLEALSA